MVRRNTVATVASLLTFQALPRPVAAHDAVGGSTSSGFSWDASDGCPTESEVEARIVQRSKGPRRPWRWRAHVVREGAGFRVSLGDGEAERIIVAPTCEAAADAVAALAALAFDDATNARAAPEAMPPAAQPTATHEDEDEEHAGTRRVKSTRAFAVAHVSATLDTATLPSPSAGIELGAGGRRGVAFAGVALRAFLPSASRVDDGRVQATIGAFEGVVNGCALASLGTSAELGGCLGGGVGLLYGSSAGVVNPRSAFGWRPQGEVSGRAGFAVSPSVWLRAESGLVVDPLQSPFRIENVGDVHRPGVVTFRGSLGVEVRFR